MLHVLQVVAVVLVSIAMALSLAHALELPGKLRLPRDDYLTMQQVYAPGFAIGGAVGEFGGIIATGLLLIETPPGPARVLTATALAAIVVMHLVFWAVTKPVNQYWFLPRSQVPQDWMALRNRWETSHLVRAVLAAAGFILLVIAAIATR